MYDMNPNEQIFDELQAWLINGKDNRWTYNYLGWGFTTPGFCCPGGWLYFRVTGKICRRGVEVFSVVKELGMGSDIAIRLFCMLKPPHTSEMFLEAFNHWRTTGKLPSYLFLEDPFYLGVGTLELSQE